MGKKVPDSLKDLIGEEPERILSYLDLKKIGAAKNPYKEFLHQFKKNFDSVRGWNLWQYFEGRYRDLNKLYKNDLIQGYLPKEFTGSLKRSEAKGFWGRTNAAEKREKDFAKQEKKIRQAQLTEPAYAGAVTTKKPLHSYTAFQKRFIYNRKEMSLKELQKEFNTEFKTNLSYFAIRDRRLRELGKKPGR